MNQYRSAMDRVEVPDGLEERLKERLADERPGARTIRPFSFGRKVLAAALAAALLTLSVGAALVRWDRILTERFGAETEQTELGQSAFQEVNITSVCDEAALTVRQVLTDDKTVCMVVDYRFPKAALPEDLSPEALQLPELWYCTGETSWEAFREEEQHLWPTENWDQEAVGTYWQESPFLQAHGLSNGGSSMETENVDLKNGVLTMLCTVHCDGEMSFSEQPLTLVAAPVLAEGRALSAHPAVVSFQPVKNSRTAVGSYQAPDRSLSAEVTVSTFTVSAETWYGYSDSLKLRNDTALLFRDGRVVPVAELSPGYGGRSGENSAEFSTNVFRELLDVTQVRAVRIGEVEIPVELQ